MVQQSAPPGIWDEDPDGASILLATGRARHDLLVIAEPAFLRDLDQAWGRPSARVRLSFLPGVQAPSAPGQEDALVSYERGGLGVLVARGRTSMYEGEAARGATALARIASGARLRAALLVTRATPLRGSGDVAGGGRRRGRCASSPTTSTSPVVLSSRPLAWSRPAGMPGSPSAWRTFAA